MGVRMTQLTVADMQLGARNALQTIKSVDSDLEHIARQGAQETQANIDRIDTGDMRDDVSYRKVASGATFSTWAFGWVNRFQRYYHFQEDGFIHWRSGNEIAGMHALKDATEEARATLKRASAEIVHKAAGNLVGKGGRRR
ncbi:hypothetical protein CN1A_48 [Clavibacter phage CN1A]|uniref:Tail protein n=1 Tax=Clavibacter phage CN1A TaxID=1406793 RepID=U5PX41_9CAUD|nr:hypothetical protein CN1A_48 [Clavibacter phage CN1A]AGY47157.1 hypothetical protein CN1A_48 [Clavibacter phage CN1A]